jgi:segregation and condensation protein B
MTMSETVTESKVAELGSNADEPESQKIDDDLRLLEALMFASASAVTERAIAERLAENADISALLERLKEMYKGRGVELTRAGNRWYFRTAPDLGDRLKLEKIVPRKLSRAGVETLAIIAYHQPVTRAEIEEIRGVAISRGTLDILLEEGWIKPKGKRHTPGRPTTWGTSDTFLDHFGLESLNDLPGIEELKVAGLLDARQGVVSYTARAGDGDTLLFDTDESDEVLEPLAEDDVQSGPTDGVSELEVENSSGEAEGKGPSEPVDGVSEPEVEASSGEMERGIPEDVNLTDIEKPDEDEPQTPKSG